MDAQIENHLPLITSRIVFAPKVFSSPPSITPRMEFPSIHIEARDDSPVPEYGGHQQRRAGTPATTLKRASTPSSSAKAHGSPRHSNAVGPSSAQVNRVTFDENMDLDSLSSLTDDEDMDVFEETEASEVEHDGEGAGEELIPKPKGEVGRPGRGGYNLFKALGWNQKTYDNVLVSKCGVYQGIYISPITRHWSQRLLGISWTQHKAIEDRAKKRYSSL
jgi:hypothetical protein